jgi:hypothetical protein
LHSCRLTVPMRMEWKSFGIEEMVILCAVSPRVYCNRNWTNFRVQIQVRALPWTCPVIRFPVLSFRTSPSLEKPNVSTVSRTIPFHCQPIHPFLPFPLHRAWQQIHHTLSNGRSLRHAEHKAKLLGILGQSESLRVRDKAEWGRVRSLDPRNWMSPYAQRRYYCTCYCIYA